MGTDCIMQQCSVVDACMRGLQAVCRFKVPLVSAYTAVKPEEKVSFCVWSDVLMSCAPTVQFNVYRMYAALSQQTDKLRHERNVSSRSIPAIQVCEGYVYGQSYVIALYSCTWCHGKWLGKSMYVDSHIRWY